MNEAAVIGGFLICDLPHRSSSGGQSPLVNELAPQRWTAAAGKSSFIRRSAGRGCRAADEALSAFCQRAQIAKKAAEKRWS
jgi:hypothetical protein